MAQKIDETHDPKLESWVESANDPETDFPIQNLPFARFEYRADHERAGQSSLGVVVGDFLVDLAVIAEARLLDDIIPETPKPMGYEFEFLQNLLYHSPDPPTRRALRTRLSELLRRESTLIAGNEWLRSTALISVDSVELLSLDEVVSDYTDFYASLFHATNVGSMFRPDNPILPNYKHIPIAYHGRASSLVASGTEIMRPCGQQAPAEEGGSPGFGPCKLLDYELEVGVVVGRGNEIGEPVSIEDAEDHILGLCLVNDWSARDMQKWEYQPLGPFLAKSFATTVSPYIVTMEALAPFRTPAFERPAGDPQPLEYLQSEANRASGGIDITLEVYIASEEMRKRGMSPMRLSKGTFRDMYWTIAQMLTHHTSNGCNLQAGDLLASGTVSGPTRDSRGCLLELTWDGDAFADPPKIVPGTQRTAIELPTGETRKFLADGDEVILKGYCEREGFRRIGFGECRGVVKPARE